MIRKFVLAAAAAALACAPVAAETVVVTAARMVDVLAGRVVERPVVVIEDGRIASVSTGAAPAGLPEDARRIDLAGMTLLPGLIDMHVHLGGHPEVRGYRSLEFTDSFFLVTGVPNAEKLLDAGFTTVRSLGAPGHLDVALRQAIELGAIEGPRIVAATFPIGATGGHCDENTNRPSLARTAPGVADGPEAVRAKVRELRKLGAQLIRSAPPAASSRATPIRARSR